MRRSLASRIVSGLVIIAFGVLVLLQAFGINSFGDLADSWWTLFIIVPGLAGIASSGFHFWNVFLVFLGIWLLADDQGWVHGDAWPYFLGGILILFGIWLITGRSHHAYSGAQRAAFESSDDFPEYTGVFTNNSFVNRSKGFRGGKASSVFGSITVDLRDISISSTAVFEVASVFGNLNVIIPRGIPVVVEVVPVFGSVSNTVPLAAPEGRPCLRIKGAAVFGSVKII